MNITLVTWFLSPNFGTTLQAYSLTFVLRKLGHNVVCLENITSLSYFKLIAYWLLKAPYHWLLEYCLPFIKDEQSKKLEAFAKEVYPLTIIRSNYSLKRLLDRTDVFMTGSDQIWNTRALFRPFYFLDFAKNSKKVAYATSIGTDDIKEEHRECVKSYLSSFSHIGVREKTAKIYLSKLMNNDKIQQVLDPTFLVTSEEWKEFAKKAELFVKLPKQYILCYMLGKNKQYINQIKDILEKSDVKNIIIVESNENREFNIGNSMLVKNVGPREFVYLILHSCLVCTDSFHASALSINLSKDFVEFLRYSDADKGSQNSRIYNLLDNYGLKSRLYNKENPFLCLSKIDYSYVQKKLLEERRQSFGFLEFELSDNGKTI